jgi:hypothetical protein
MPLPVHKIRAQISFVKPPSVGMETTVAPFPSVPKLTRATMVVTTRPITPRECSLARRIGIESMIRTEVGDVTNQSRRKLTNDNVFVEKNLAAAYEEPTIRRRDEFTFIKKLRKMRRLKMLID